MKQTLKSALPTPVLQFARDTYDAIRRIPQLPAAYLHPWRRESIRRLAELKDIHKGKRAFIIGNGPSLKQTDLTKLKNEITFGMNRIYLLFPELGFHTTYFCATNDLVIEQFHQDILELPMPKFLAWRSHRHFSTKICRFQIFQLLFTRPIQARVSLPMFVGGFGRVLPLPTLLCSLAFHMGIEQVILIGVDHNFTSKGDANKTVISQGDDPNHVHPDYFGKGIKWQLPDLDTSEIGYAFARDCLSKSRT